MALIDNLIEHNAPGIGLLTDPAGQFLRQSGEPAGRRRWRAWAAAERARRHHEHSACKQWLQTALNVEGDDEPARLWRTEMLVTSGRLERAEEEPAAALEHLYAGWESWLDVWNAFQNGALNLEQAVIGIWVNDMVGSLADEDDRIEPGSAQVMLTWMSERMIHQLHEVGCDVIDLAGRLGAIDVAQEVAGTLLPLISSMTEPPSRLVLTSRVRLDLGNAYQNVERIEDAIAAFEAAIEDLDPIRGQGDIDMRIARLEFNRANGLLRLGRTSEAIAVYDRVMETFHQPRRARGRAPRALREAVRARARMIAGQAEQELREIVDGYEKLLAEAGRDASERARLRAALEPAYRSLLSRLAERFDQDPDVLDELLSIVAGLRDEAATSVRSKDDEAAELALEALRTRPLGLLDRRLGRLPGTLLLLAEPAGPGMVLIALRGSGGGEDRAAVAQGDAALIFAAQDLIAAYGEAAGSIIAREVSEMDLDPAPVEAAAARFATKIPEPIRHAVSAATTVLWSPSAAGGGDALPFELVPIGERPVGLERAVVRVPSLRMLADILAPNRFNMQPGSTAVVVRAGEVAELVSLPEAGQEVEGAQRGMTALGLESRVLESPTAAEMIDALGKGGRLVHYIGHGLADAAGEQLLLGPGVSLRAQALEGALPTRAPFAYLSACLVGRSRHISGGGQKGFAVALLDAGAPGLVAATFEVPSHLCARAARAFHAAATKSPVGEAIRQAREALAGKGWHPVAWSAFGLWGDPAAAVAASLPAQGSARETLDWPSLLTRMLASGSEHYERACLAAIATAAESLEAEADILGAVSKAIAARDAEEARRWIDEVARFDLEGAAALRLMIADARLAEGGEQEDLLREVGAALGLALRLSDSYAFLHFVAHHGGVNAWLVERVTLLNEAERRLAHLAADAEALSAVADELRAGLEGLRGAQVLDAPTLLGVDPELYARADAGDEEAMREVTRQVVMRQGSASTDVRGAPGWRDAMLRHIGTSSQQSWADVLRLIKGDRASGTPDPRLAAALDTLAAGFIGPSMAPASAYKGVRDALGDDEADQLAIDAFELYDEFQSDPDNFDITHAEAGQAVGERLGDDGVISCFVLIASTQWARAGDVDRAMTLALRGLSLVAKLHETDHDYRDQLQRAATNALNFATYLGETHTADSLERTFGELIAEFESKG